MLNDFIKSHFVSKAGYVEYGYGQVEPNHLSAQRNGQIYAQLPAAANIDQLEQGQFVKYDYAKGVVDFEGPGEWMMVFNEIKLYRDPQQMDCEFAMVKEHYNARVYSPFGYGVDKDGNPTADGDTAWDRQTRYYAGVDANGEDHVELNGKSYKYDRVTIPNDKADPYELHYNDDPFHIEGPYKEKRMPEGTTMVPRVLKTMVGDIYTTNTVAETTLAVGDVLSPRPDDGILSKTGDNSIQWQVVKVYTMPDHQRGVKLMRIA